MFDIVLEEKLRLCIYRELYTVRKIVCVWLRCKINIYVYYMKMESPLKYPLKLNIFVSVQYTYALCTMCLFIYNVERIYIKYMFLTLLHTQTHTRKKNTYKITLLQQQTDEHVSGAAVVVYLCMYFENFFYVVFFFSLPYKSTIY